ncbi:hypothetical protein ACFW6E_00420 [Streptomyces olivaceoviridis]|uniref:hypothetical protein n=1 Tax=Streptomyces olivaceoviridis TaxID=1921 RepID=UPI0036B4D0F7
MSTPAEQLSLISPDEPAHQLADDAVRLLLFNAQHASPDRSRHQAAWVAARENADIAVFTEVSPTQGGDALVTALTERGYAPLRLHTPTPSASSPATTTRKPAKRG